MKLVIATSNAGKVKEFNEALKGLGFDLLLAKDAGINEFPEETGSTYQENAMIKAVHAAHISGELSLADDSGIEVDALNGAPGLYSARYGNLDSDVERTKYLLEQLKGVSEPARTAKFACSLVLVNKQGQTQSFYGEAKGRILLEPVSALSGFGYDPVFYSDALGKSFAEVTKADKQQVSHRGEALKVFKAWLESSEAKVFLKSA